MEGRNKENDSTEKSEERMSCRPTSVEAEKGQETSGEAEIAKNSAQGTKRKRDTKNSTACGPGDMSQRCDGVKPPKAPTRIPIPPLPAVLPPVNLVHRDVIRAWCQQLKLSTKGPKLDGYKRLCEYTYPHQKKIPATAQEARILSLSKRIKIEKGELPLECSVERMSSEGAAPPAPGPPALEGAPLPPEAVVSTSAPNSEAVFAAWSRMTARAVKMESVRSQETCEVQWCVVHRRSLPANTEGWVRLQFHAGQAWVPGKRRRVSAFFLIPSGDFPPPHLEDNMLCPECVHRNNLLTKSLQ
ncbi:developmental pluripotency-associated protein 4-like [Bubalus kerabau]|uniref:developmental pluripotency-associated protein 4-like n=1 Tax=Bubalus carabanensis TaxID=3119969 RepID=UPI00244EE307|nr:developmental pluripotency-associated protein 4-like [Bubalus carabanensis]